MKSRRQPRPGRRPRAGTRDVLPPPARRERIEPRWRKHYDRLVELRDSLLHQGADLAKAALEEQPRFGTHMADAGTDEYDRDFALGMLSSEQDAVYEIEQALDRIRNGTYGVCELTGKRIPEARLEAVPWTRFTAEAEQKLEREGELRRARLGPRETVVRVKAAG
jgi:DnaK suppressor protein